MDEKLYRSEPIPRRPSHRPMNGSRADARETLARIMADERFNSSVRTAATTVQSDAKPHKAESLFSNLDSSRQPFDLPDRYHEMRNISRWQEGTGSQPGHWLTEAELFYRQGIFMADWEDACPYTGLFKSYFPTYNAMSDRQLRGYFTWRTAVRAGDIQETSLSFAYVYLYELINGIGVADPLDGFRKIEAFWQAYRAFAPELDRYVNVWLQDYAVYHGLDPEVLAPYRTVAFDRALIALRHANAEMVSVPGASTGRHKRGESTIPLSPNTAREEQLFQAVDALSSYRLSNSRLYKEQTDALRHVACAVYVRLSERHRKQGKNSLLESWFGEQIALPYTMFGSAVFFEPARHTDAVYELDEIHRYRCERGLWTCERFHGSQSRSPKLGAVMRAVDRSLRDALDPEHPLKDDGKTPKYLQKIIDHEIEAWITWSKVYAPVRVDIDLSQLAGIRSAAAETREALLIDEEREEAGEPTTGNATDEQRCIIDTFSTLSNPLKRIDCATMLENQTERDEQSGSDSPLSPEQAAYLRGLLGGDRAQAATASEDLLVDTINETLFDQIGDTVIEYDADGTPQLIEDYREDVEGILNHE